MNFSLFTAVFLCIGWIVEISGNEHPAHCCPEVTNVRISVEKIVSYSIQEPPLCPIKAVRFYGKQNKVICSDPNSDWAKRVIYKLSPTTETHKVIQCHTTKTTQTTTQKTPGTKIETSTRTATVQPTVTVINTSGPETSTSTTLTISESEDSTSTTITTSRPETGKSTTVTTIKSSQLETENSKRNPNNFETSPQTSLNTMTTCGTGEPMTPTKEKKHKTSSNRVTSTTPAKRTKPSRLKIKARKKSKKEFRKLQINRINSRN